MKEEIENNIPLLKEGNTDRYVKLKEMPFRKIGLYVNSRFQEDRAIPFIDIFVDKSKSMIQRLLSKIRLAKFSKGHCVYTNTTVYYGILETEMMV